MATVTPASFRNAITTRTKATLNLEFSPEEIDQAGAAAFNAAFPALFTRTVTAGVLPTYNALNDYSSITVADATRVYEVEDDTSEMTLWGWQPKGLTTIRRLPGQLVSTVSVHAIAPINYPTVSVDVPDEWPDALYTYAEMSLVELLANDFSQYRGYKANSREGMVDETDLQNLVTNLYNKWTRERDERAMVMPMVKV